jgi:superfamily II DNA or RNA helicase
MAVLPTGGGKTITFGHILANWQYGGVTWAVAHRQELVGQISCALAAFEIEHQIIAPNNTVKWIMGLHTEKYGRPYYAMNAPVIVAGVQTLLRRKGLESLYEMTTGWVMDEGHHCLLKNSWGKAVSLFPETAKGLLVTATPLRADGKGLGRHAEGVVDKLIEGPNGRWMINNGFLSEYRVFAPKSSHDAMHRLSRMHTTAGGDYSQKNQVEAMGRSEVVGNIVDAYLEYAPGKLGVTFVPNVEIAGDVASQFVAAGVPAESVSSKTQDRDRQNIVARFARRELLQLVNVDLFGEGFDLPAIEVIQMARPTESFSLYCQQFGRALRPMPGKKHAIIIDHAGNVARMAVKYGLPDMPPAWSLDSRTRNKVDPDTIPVKICQKCTAVFEAFWPKCPVCGYTNPPAERSAPEFVDGDLTELDPDVLMAMRREVARVDESPNAVRQRMAAAGAPGHVAGGAAKQHRLRQEAQAILRDTIALWAGWQKHHGRPDTESYRRFYHTFGVDVMSAQALGRPDAIKLNERIEKEIIKCQ